MYFFPLWTIQPCVENTIIHAIGPNAKGGKMTITRRSLKDIVVLKVLDGGVGISENEIEKILDGTYESGENNKNTGIGISNANKRLMYYYGVEYGVDIKAVLGKGTEITISMPRKSLKGRGL